MTDAASTSTRPYLIRAIHEWCTDNGFTPYLAVRVDQTVRVPMEFVSDGEIVLNVSYDATGSLVLGNEFIEFKARFGGKARDIIVPVERVLAIYARESGQGMSFPVIETQADAAVHADVADTALSEDEDQVSDADTAASRVVQLVPTGAARAQEDADDDSTPPPVAPTPGKRPALKRVK